jgi:hypothetical protein
VAEDRSQLVVAELADEPGFQAQRSQPRDRVGGGAAARLPGRSHRLVEARRLGFVDQLHRALVHAVRGEEGVVGVGDDIDDRIADGEHVEAAVGHSGLRG